MVKEIIIIIIVITIIFVGDVIMQKYTNNIINELSSKLLELKENIKESNQEKAKDEIKKQIEEVHEKWIQKSKYLSVLIEHTELEKVETSLISSKSFIENEEYDKAISELDKSIYLLNHVKEKYEFEWQKIF